MNFTADQARKYYENRMGGEIRKRGTSYMGKCPFHDDADPSMSFNFEKGVWRCHTCNIGGGMMDFEMKLNGIGEMEALAAVNAVMGTSQSAFSYSKPEAIYQYRDEQHRLLYEILRTRNPQTGKKNTPVRRPVGTGGWEWTVEGTRKVLYRLPELIRAADVFVVEGEKCADALRNAYNEMTGETDAFEQKGIAATTSPFGAGKWREEYAPFFAGKRVMLLPDNDQPGQDHMESVARSVARYAVGVKWLDIPGLEAKGDVADYLEKHSFGDLEALFPTARTWRPILDTGFFLSARSFMRHTTARIEWLVDGVIEKGTSGFIIALPKSGKSVGTVALAASLASGQDWLDFRVPNAVRTALVSREDAPGLTARRLWRCIKGLNMDPNDEVWETNLLVNTRDQSAAMQIDDPEQLASLIENLKAKQIEFCILDVFNKLHEADENDNTEMRRVLNKVEQIRSEVGCQICIVHHSVKEWDETKTLSQLARGSSAISGFAEYIIGMRLVDAETQTRQMMFETKSSEPAKPLHWKIRDAPLTGALVVERVEYEEQKASPRKRALSVVGK